MRWCTKIYKYELCLRHLIHSPHPSTIVTTPHFIYLDEEKWKQGETKAKAWDQNESKVDADIANIWSCCNIDHKVYYKYDYNIMLTSKNRSMIMSQESPIWHRAREQGRRRGRKEASSGCGSCSATSAFSLLWCLWWRSSSCRKFRSGRWSDSPDLSAPSQLWSTCHLAVKPCPFHVLVLLLSPIFTKFWLQGKNWFYQPPYFIKNFISTTVPALTTSLF